jgi:hypothetical protein
MTCPDASANEMLRLPFPNWLGHEPDGPLLETMIAGTLPADAPQRIRVLAARLTELAVPAGAWPGDGETVAMSAFRRTVSAASAMPLASPQRHRRRRRPLAVSRTGQAAAVATATIAVGGTAAAYARVLRRPVQDFAHRLIHAPPAHHGPVHRPGRSQP